MKLPSVGEEHDPLGQRQVQQSGILCDKIFLSCMLVNIKEYKLKNSAYNEAGNQDTAQKIILIKIMIFLYHYSRDSYLVTSSCLMLRLSTSLFLY